MNLEYTHQIADKYGLGAAAHDVAVRAVNKLGHFEILHAMVLTMDTLDRSYLEGPGFTWGFLGEAALLDKARAEGADLDEAFVRDAMAHGDRCYAALDGDTLASYGFYSTRPTPIDEHAVLHFDPAYAYMYKGFTRPAYRGKRLHGIGMARATAELVAEGKRGLVSYVRSNNFASLRSCYRLGYRDFGRIVLASFGDVRRAWASAGCKRFGFRAEVVDAPEAVTARAA
ncbi:MAG TPA: hypothetical protein VHB21_07395 [Minicystis sp.]|nr:hypothetical protein [Minicystis sp.]